MLILTSSNAFVTQHFIRHLPKSPKELKLTFIPTAADVETGSLEWLNQDREALVTAGFQVTDFTLTGKSPTQTKSMLDQTDFVFVSGGNTFYLLQEMNKSGFSKMIKEYVGRGLIYGGTSAGSVVASPDISVIQLLDDPSLAPELTSYLALNLTDVLVLPHWGSPHFHDDYAKMTAENYKTGSKVILLTDDQYLLIKDKTYSIESI